MGRRKNRAKGQWAPVDPKMFHFGGGLPHINELTNDDDGRAILFSSMRDSGVRDAAHLICAAAWEALAWKGCPKRRWLIKQWADFIVKDTQVVQTAMDILVTIGVMGRSDDDLYETVLTPGEMTAALKILDPEFKDAITELGKKAQRFASTYL